MPTPTKIAVIVILESRNHWLMLKRKNSPNKGLFVPVGGKLENGESPRAAAIREVDEETGFQIEEVHYKGLLIDSSPADYNWTCFVYQAEIEYVSPPSCSEGMLIWVPIESLSKLPTPETDPYLYPLILSGKPFFISAAYSQEDKLIQLTEEISETQLYP